MCPVCEGASFREVIWVNETGTEWPALECTECGTLLRQKSGGAWGCPHDRQSPAVSGTFAAISPAFGLVRRAP
jgi:hypothetical protein